MLLVGAAHKAGDADWSWERRYRRTGRNTGNLLIGHGACRQLQHAAFEKPAKESAARLRERFDRIVVAASNFLNRYTDLSRMADLVESVDLPCLVVGLGAQANDYESIAGDISAGTVRLVRALAERTRVVGVRGEYSASILRDLGVGNVAVLGCPSFHTNLSAPLRVAQKRFEDMECIVVTGTADVTEHSFDGPAKAQVERTLFRLADTSNYRYVFQSELPEILYLEQPGPERAAALAPSARRMGYESVAEYASVVRRIGRVFFDVGEWLAFMRGQDLVIGTRLHGAVAGLLQGVPAIILYHDARTRELCELMRFPHLSVTEARDLSLEAICDRVRFDEVTPRHAALIPRYVDFLEANGVEHRFALGGPSRQAPA